MSWRDRLLPASFRGASFKIQRHSATPAGRRLAVHEYPGEDEPYPEDLGHRASTYQVNGYVIGADYHIERDALVRACDQAGPGSLVHPYLGTLRVACEECRVDESAEEGRIARVSMRFVQGGRNAHPSARTDTGAAAGAAAVLARAASRSAFTERWLA